MVQLKELQDFIIFLVHIVSGGPGRAQDVLDIMLVHTPTSGHVYALSEITMKIEALVHKNPDVQHNFGRKISRFPNYTTAKLISLFVAFTQGAISGHGRLWLPSVRNDMDLTRCFERAASQCFRHHLHFNWWRHIVQILVARGYQELNNIEGSLDVPGSRTLLAIEQEAVDSAAAPSVANRLTQQHAHSIATAAMNYGTKLVSPTDWQLASMSYQRFLQIENASDEVSEGSGNCKFQA